jgi:tetratricopeptide (TPR) repeat protein
MKDAPRKFNPGLNQDDKSLIDQFVLRLPLLDILLETVEENTKQPICQHRLYYGPRGRGKTMLLARAAAELRTNPKFSEHWIPIRLLEESYYEISNIAEFWLEVMAELTRNLPADHKDRAENSLQNLYGNWTHPNLNRMAQAVVCEQLDKVGRKAVIMIENFHQLLDEVNDDDFGWEIRRIMQNEPTLMFLVTSTTRFDKLDNADQPFYEIFATAELSPLKRSESAKLWNNLTNSTKTETEVAPLDILTGGSPRLLNIVAQFANTHSIRALMENLTGLIDEYTEYFKSQLDALAPKERRVFVALADLWKESTAAEIAERARLDIRTTSALLGRLELKGALTVNADMPRRKTYLVAERLFCIYYKLRRERNQEAVIDSLVQFMVAFYTPSEIDTVRSMYGNYAAVAQEEVQFISRLQALAPANQSMPENDVYFNVKAVAERSVGDAITVKLGDVDNDDLNSGIDGFGLNEVRDKTSIAPAQFDRQTADILWRADELIVQDKPAEALAYFDSIIQRHEVGGQQTTMDEMARAMLGQAFAYAMQGEIAKALAGYDKLIDRYGDSDEPALMKQVASAMFNQAFAHSQQGDIGKALAGYDKLIDRYRDSDAPALIEQVAKAMLNQANAHGRRGDIAKALAGYDEIVERYQSTNAPRVISVVTGAMINQANTLAEASRWTLAEDAYTTVSRYVEGKVFDERENYSTTASLGVLVARKAPEMSKAVQSALVRVIRKATRQPPADERMVLAMGIAAVLPVATALDIIRESAGSDALEPIIVALQLELGEKIRTAVEILEVAADVRKRLPELREEYCSAASN